MSMRLYKVNGQYYTWDYLHNELGYTESASTTTTYKSSDSDTWGQSIVDSGYRIATDSSDLETYEFWIDNVSGWFSASEMAQEGYYPSFATDGPRFVKEGELSVSVEISGNSWSGSWYLLKKDVSIGWCTVRELEENGWEPDQGEIVGGLISDTYDKRIYSFGNGGLLVPGGYAYQDGDLLDMTWDFGGMVEEDVIKNIIYLTADSYGMTQHEIDSDETYICIEVPIPSEIDVDLGLRQNNGSWSSVRLNDWWYGGLLNQNDVDTVTQFGLSAMANDRVSSLGNLEFNPSYKYRITNIFTNIVDGHGSDSITLDLNNFYIENSNKYPSYDFKNQVFFEYISSLNTYAKAYRVHIEKIAPPLTRQTAYTSISKTATQISNGSYVSLYDSNGDLIIVGKNMRYDLIVYYTSSSGDPYSYKDTNFLYIDFWTNSYIVLRNGSDNSITIQRIEYTSCEKS